MSRGRAQLSPELMLPGHHRPLVLAHALALRRGGSFSRSAGSNSRRARMLPTRMGASRAAIRTPRADAARPRTGTGLPPNREQTRVPTGADPRLPSREARHGTSEAPGGVAELWCSGERRRESDPQAPRGEGSFTARSRIVRRDLRLHQPHRGGGSGSRARRRSARWLRSSGRRRTTWRAAASVAGAATADGSRPGNPRRYGRRRRFSGRRPVRVRKTWRELRRRDVDVGRDRVSPG